MTDLPLAPLFDRVEWSTGRVIHRDPCPFCRHIADPDATCLRVRALSELLGVSTRRITKWQRTGFVDLSFADHIAVRLGWHPDAIWGPNWHDVDWDAD